MECPDYWLAKGNPWEIERADVTYKVRFGGQFTRSGPLAGVAHWDGGEVVLAMAYDTPVPGFNTYNTYTDASNYERTRIGWSGNQFQIQNQRLGTGAVRDISQLER